MVRSLRQSWNHARARWLLGFALVLEFFEHRPMGCPFCGDVCHCTPELPVRDPCAPPSSQFQPNGNPVSNSSSPAGPVILDPEAHEASEERFSARLDASVDQPADAVHPRSPGAVMCGNEQSVSPGSSEDNSVVPAGSSFWKDQVAERLNNYRARRKPRPPRYPSLRLKFEPAEPTCEDLKGTDETAPEPSPMPKSAAPFGSSPAPEQTVPPEAGRISEFPRSCSALVSSPDELAEPVVESPRMVEAPEIPSPAPALGGIILEPEETEPEKQPGFEIPLQAAPVPRRILAGACDGLVVTSACALFALIFFKLTAFVPRSPGLLVLAVGIGCFFWAGYQCLLMVYTGSTPGLRLARLRLSHFDGSPVSSRTRCWRVLASVLSALSLGLGFAWCYLDEDALCWHDRITRTYLATKQNQ